MTLGQYLKDIRGERSIGQIAMKSDIDKGYLSKIERDERKPKPEMLKNLADAYGADYQELLKLNGQVPDDFVVIARKVGDVTEEQRLRLYRTLDKSIDDFLDKIKDNPEEGN